MREAKSKNTVYSRHQSAKASKPPNQKYLRLQRPRSFWALFFDLYIVLIEGFLRVGLFPPIRRFGWTASYLFTVVDIRPQEAGRGRPPSIQDDPRTGHPHQHPHQQRRIVVAAAAGILTSIFTSSGGSSWQQPPAAAAARQTI